MLLSNFSNHGEKTKNVFENGWWITTHLWYVKPFLLQGLKKVIATGFIPLSLLYIILRTVIWEGSRWLEKFKPAEQTSSQESGPDVSSQDGPSPVGSRSKSQISSGDTSSLQTDFLCPRIEISWGGGTFFYCCPSVRPSIRLSVCTNLTWKLNIFPLLLN